MILLCLLSTITTHSGYTSTDIYRNLKYCDTQPCDSSGFKSTHELENVGMVSIETKTAFSNEYNVTVNVTVDTLNTSSYVDHTILSSGVSGYYFNPESGLFVLKTPAHGHGFLSSVSFNVSHVGVMKIYSLEKNEGCDAYSNFWKCLSNSHLWDEFWSDGISSALDELEFYSLDSLEDTFRVVTTEEFNLTSIGFNTKQTRMIIAKGNYLGFESLSATVFSNNFSLSNSIIYKNYNTPKESSIVPFFNAVLSYKTYQLYAFNYSGIKSVTPLDNPTDIKEISSLDEQDGILIISRNISGFFTSYKLRINIPSWQTWGPSYANQDFHLESIVDGNLINGDFTSQALYDTIPIDPPSVIVGPKFVINFPDISINAQLENITSNEALFLDSIIAQNWTLSPLNTDIVIFSSEGDNFKYDDLVMPSFYKLTTTVNTTFGVVFTIHHIFEFVSQEFTILKCLLNCDPDFTTPFVKLRLALDSEFRYGFTSAVWYVYELDTDREITSEVTVFDHLPELLVDTSLLTKKQYVINVHVYTQTTKTSLHDSFLFNMSYPVFNLYCNVFPNEGVALETAHSISCSLTINGINCMYCKFLDTDLCEPCLREYVYFFRLCLDHGTCKSFTPLAIGNTTEPGIDSIILPAGDPSSGFITTVIVCLYDKLYTAIEYVHKHVSIVSKTNEAFNISSILDTFNVSDDKEEIFANLNKLGAAFSTTEDFDDKTKNRTFEILNNIENFDDKDISMQAFSVLLGISKMKLSDNMTENLNILTQKAYQNVQSLSEELVETASYTMWSIMDNVFGKNTEIANITLGIPDYDFVFATDSPDRQYYNKWVNVDYEVEAKAIKDAKRSDGICDNIGILNNWGSQAIAKDLGVGEVSHINLRSDIQFSIGKINKNLVNAGFQLVGLEYAYISMKSNMWNDLIFTDIMNIAFVIFRDNPCILVPNSDRIKTSVIGFNVTLPSRFVDQIKWSDEPIEVLLPTRKVAPMLEFLYDPNNGFSYFQVDVFARSDMSIFLQVMCSRTTTVFIRSKSLPKALQWEFKYQFPDKSRVAQRKQKITELNFSPRNETSIFDVQVPFVHNDTYYIGVQVASKSPRRARILLYMTACLEWVDNGWVVQPKESAGILSNSSFIHCKFNNPSIIYGADLSYPNLVAYKTPVAEKNLSEKLLNSMMIWLPLIVIYCYFFCTSTTIHRLDVRDIHSSNVLHSLSSRTSRFCYKISIKTGIRLRAGTTSNVSLELHGMLGSVKADISQDEGEFFNTNQTSHFVFYADSDIGPIDKVSVWVDYTGRSPDWFLESCKITDQRNNVYMFIYNNWIGFDIKRYGCSIVRFSPTNVPLLRKLFLVLKEYFFNQHSMISSLLKGNRLFPSRKYLSAMFVSRYITILCIIAASLANSGQLTLTGNSLMEIIYMLSLTFPLFFIIEKLNELLLKNERHNCFIKRMLTKSDSKDSLQSDKINQYFWVTAPSPKHSITKSPSVKDPLEEYFDLTCDQEKEIDKPASTSSSYLDDGPILDGVTDFGRRITEKDIKIDDYFPLFWGENADSVSLLSFEREKPLASLPSVEYKLSPSLAKKFLIIFPYLVSVVSSSVYLIYMYTATVNVSTCLLSFGIALLLIIFIEQPLVCFIMGLVFWHRIRHVKPDLMTYCHTDEKPVKSAVKLTKDGTLPNPKTWKKVLNIRRRMNIVVFKLFSYIVFIIVVVILSKQDRKTSCFYLNTSVRRVFATPMFENVRSKADFWNWVQTDYASSLSSEDFYNNTRAKIPREKYLKDSSSIIISISRMRQIRLKSINCSVDSMIVKTKGCTLPFRSSLMDTNHYDPKWKTYTNASEDTDFPVIRYKSYWLYQEESDSVSITGRLAKYPGSGFMVPLVNTPKNARMQLKMLRNDEWIDDQTRAVFVELSVYNPPTGFLCTVKLIAEFLPTGNVVTTSQLHSINFQLYADKIIVSRIKIEIVYIFCLLVLTIHDINNIYDAHKNGYTLWRGFWSVLDYCTLFSGWTGVYMYIDRYIKIHLALEKFVATPYYYIDFHKAAQSDIYFGYCLGALVFLVTVKIVDLFIVHVKVKQMTLIIHNSIIELASFSIPFAILLSVFSQVFYCLYSPYMAEFSTVSGSFGQTFAFVLGEVNWESMISTRRYLTPFFCCIFGVLSIAYIGNMFAVIVVYNTANIRLNPPGNDQHLAIFGYLREKLKDVIFIFLPIIVDAYNVIKKSVIVKSSPLDNPYYVAPSNTTLSSISMQDTVDGPDDQALSSLQTIAESRKESILHLKSKLRVQARTLRKLNSVLKTLDGRIEKLMGS